MSTAQLNPTATKFTLKRPSETSVEALRDDIWGEADAPIAKEPFKVTLKSAPDSLPVRLPINIDQIYELLVEYIKECVDDVDVSNIEGELKDIYMEEGGESFNLSLYERLASGLERLYDVNSRTKGDREMISQLLAMLPTLREKAAARLEEFCDIISKDSINLKRVLVTTKLVRKGKSAKNQSSNEGGSTNKGKSFKELLLPVVKPFLAIDTILLKSTMCSENVKFTSCRAKTYSATKQGGATEMIQGVELTLQRSLFVFLQQTVIQNKTIITNIQPEAVADIQNAITEQIVCKDFQMSNIMRVCSYKQKPKTFSLFRNVAFSDININGAYLIDSVVISDRFGDDNVNQVKIFPKNLTHKHMTVGVFDFGEDD